MRRIIACVLLPSYLAACMQWEVQEATPQQVVAQERQPDSIHVTLRDGSWVVLEHPEISGDSLIGVITEGEYLGQPLQEGCLTQVDLNEVVQVAVMKKSLKATAMPWVAAAAAVGAAVMLVGYAEFRSWTKRQ